MNKMDNNKEQKANPKAQQPNNNEEVNTSSTNTQTPNNNQESNNNQTAANNIQATQAVNDQQQKETNPQTLEESWAVIADLKRKLDDEKNVSIPKNIFNPRISIYRNSAFIIWYSNNRLNIASSKDLESFISANIVDGKKSMSKLSKYFGVQ